MVLFDSYLGSDWWVHIFLTGIGLKVNIIAQLEFELGFYNVAV